MTAVPVATQAQEPFEAGQPHEADHVLAKLVPGRPAATTLGPTAEQVFDRWHRVPVPADRTPQQVVDALSENPNVEVASLDHRVQLDPNDPVALEGPSVSAAPNDPLYPSQWHFPPVQLEQAWETSTGNDVVVAVIDTGISLGGEDLDCHTFVDPFNAITDAAGTGVANDDNGHGTHVAGTVAQCTNNGVGVAGVAIDAELMPVKVLDSDGNGSFSDVAQGIDWARTQGADVINLSLGADCGSSTWPSCSSAIVNEALEAAADEDIVIVAAAGNDASPAVGHPANHPDVIAVGAVDSNLDLAWYSSSGSALDLVAPGGDTRDGVDANGDGQPDGVRQETFTSSGWDYYFFQGTSMATPHVAGAAALIRSFAPGAGRTVVTDALLDTTMDLGSGGFDSTYGHGLVQMSDALDYFLNDGSPPSWPGGASLTLSDVTGTEATVGWPAANDNVGVAGYRVFVDGELVTSRTGTARSTRITGLTSGTTYAVAVRAMDAAGNQGPALSTSLVTLDTIPPTWPSDAELAVSRHGETSLHFGWPAASDNLGVADYQVRVDGVTADTTTSRQTTATGLQPGTAHLIEVRARDAAGNWSPFLTREVLTARSFSDTPGTVFYEDILWLSGQDITRGCNPPQNDRYCPNDPVTRGQMAAFLTRALALTPSPTNDFTDDDTSVFQTDIAALAASGITRGCNPPQNDRYCPNDPVTRGQMAAFLARALAGR